MSLDRDRLRRYLSHATMLLPPDERVVTVEEGLALLEELDALQAIHRDALSHARRIIAHPDRWHHQDLVDATSNLLSALKGAPTVRDGATQWRDRAVRAEAQSETRRQQTVYWQERAEGFEAERDEAEKVHRDLTSSLGFGDDITEPMADNKTIIEHVSRAVTDAQELWELTQAKCAEAGCDPEEDCYIHHPERRAERAEMAEEQLLLRNRNLLDAHREAKARTQAVRDVLAHHPYGGPDQEDAVRRALDAP